MYCRTIIEILELTTDRMIGEKLAEPWTYGPQRAGAVLSLAKFPHDSYPLEWW